MIDSSFCTAMAEYNAWMNGRLYEVCASIPEVELQRNRGAFFGSIYSTLNHLLYGDLAFMSRFTGDPTVVPELGKELYANFDVMSEARRALDERILKWSETVSKAWLGEKLSYESKVDGVVRTVPRWVLVTHMFNHETHHRGQVTTLLSQLGFDIGTTDIPFMPQYQQ